MIPDLWTNQVIFVIIKLVPLVMQAHTILYLIELIERNLYILAWKHHRVNLVHHEGVINVAVANSATGSGPNRMNTSQSNLSKNPRFKGILQSQGGFTSKFCSKLMLIKMIQT